MKHVVIDVRRFLTIRGSILEPQLYTIDLDGPPGRLFGAVLGHLARSASSFCSSWLHFWSILLLLAPFWGPFSTKSGFNFVVRVPFFDYSGVARCSFFVRFCLFVLSFVFVFFIFRSLVLLACWSISSFLPFFPLLFLSFFLSFLPSFLPYSLRSFTSFFRLSFFLSLFLSCLDFSFLFFSFFLSFLPSFLPFLFAFALS